MYYQNKDESNQQLPTHIEENLSMTERSDITAKTLPIVTFFLVLILWAAFFIGLATTYPTFPSSWVKDVSPNYEYLWFYTIEPWPECVDVRPQVWRIWSAQIVHDGFLHLVANCIILALYGGLVERCYPFGHFSMLLSFQLSMCAGTIGFGLIYPYRGMIGASPGIYGMMGSIIVLLLMKRHILPPLIRFTFPIVLAVHLGVDILLFYVYHDAKTAYSSHFFGLITGFLLGLAIILFSSRPKNKVRIWLGFVTTFVLASLLALMMTQRYASDPPTPLFSSGHPIIHYRAGEAQSCCQGYLTYIQRYPKLIHDSADSLGYCDGYTFHAYNSSLLQV
eukprot:gene1589-1735_t